MRGSPGISRASEKILIHTLVPLEIHILYTSPISCMQSIMYKTRSQGLVLGLSKGFTLIELLIVIAIIGILSSVVLASLNTARFRGNDAAIQSDLFAIKTQAEIYYGGLGNNSYAPPTNDCFDELSMFWVDTTIRKALAGANSANGDGVVVCNASATAYAVAATLSSDGTRQWCVDSTGSSSKSTNALNTDTVCPTAN